MQKKLTITVDSNVYSALHKVVGPRRISHFIELLVRPHVMDKNLHAAYQQMSKDEAREKEALDWSEATLKDIADESR